MQNFNANNFETVEIATVDATMFEDAYELVEVTFYGKNKNYYCVNIAKYTYTSTFVLYVAQSGYNMTTGKDLTKNQAQKLVETANNKKCNVEKLANDMSSLAARVENSVKEMEELQAELNNWRNILK